MNAGYVKEALEHAVVTYATVSRLPEPERSAAFGWACVKLMEALNCNLGTAAALLRVELDQRGL